MLNQHNTDYATQIQPDTAQPTSTQSPTTPTTPTKGSPTCRRHSTQSQGSTPRPVAVQDQWRLQFSSPSKVANISVRRPQRGFTLLHSPARPGHSICMKHIFEEASRSYCTQEDTIVHCPQLPKIGRVTSPPPSHDLASQPSAAYVSTTDRTRSTLSSTVPLSTTPQKTHPPSASWTDDSGYLATQSHDGASTFDISSQERIYDWLSKVPQNQGEGADDNLDPFLHDDCDVGAISRREWQPRQESSRMPFWDNHSSGLALNACKRLDFGQSSPMNRDADDQLVDNLSLTSLDRMPYKEITTSSLSTCPALEDGSIELSPLSPNVCVQRGPARHHLNRKRNNAASPLRFCKENPSIQEEAMRMKENFTPQEPDTTRIDSPLALRYGRVGARFGRALQDEDVPSRHT